MFEMIVQHYLTIQFPNFHILLSGCSLSNEKRKNYRSDLVFNKLKKVWRSRAVPESGLLIRFAHWQFDFAMGSWA